MGPTEEQLKIWRQFSNLYPEAAAIINAEARRIREHNTHVARTMSHGEAGLAGRWNWASALRSNIANDYMPETLWESTARRVVRTAE